MKKNYWEFRFQSEPVQARQVVREIMVFLEEAIPGLLSEVRTDLKLVFSELLFNAVIHGNALDRRKYVHIWLEVSDDTLYARISDEGSGFDYRTAIRQMHHEDDLQKESGRGMKLVFALTDAISFNDSGNQIMFVKKISRGAGGQKWKTP